MNTELKEAIEALEKEKNIMRETLFEAIENALLTACKSNFGKVDNIRVWVDRDTFEYFCVAEKEVVETEDDVEDKLLQIPLDEAVKIKPAVSVGDKIEVKINSQSFGRIATQIAKNVILQKIREEERSAIYDYYYKKQKKHQRESGQGRGTPQRERDCSGRASQTSGQDQGLRHRCAHN